jgi:diacylglycerol diphosphate phosphatase/phosphatidate phosphatase
VMRPRPNFFALCEFSVEEQRCTNSSMKRVIESQLSFPSGHSSVAWCGMTFLVLVLLGKLQRHRHRVAAGNEWQSVRHHQPWVTILCCLIPWSWAAFVAASRIVDHWHHPSDVLAGSLLGIACAVVPYHAFYPHVLSTKAGTSFAELDMSPIPDNGAESAEAEEKKL